MCRVAIRLGLNVLLPSMVGRGFTRDSAPMCGIAGLYAKNDVTAASLGSYLADMLAPLTDRGPDSAGVAIYRDDLGDRRVKISLLDPLQARNWETIRASVAALGDAELLRDLGDQALLSVEASADHARAWLSERHPEVIVMSVGHAIETYKRAGVADGAGGLIETSGLRELSGSHAVAHTRMATESRVTTEHSHPFSTGTDLCLVHNGSLSNHNRLRRSLQRRGVSFATDNDSEVAAGYLTWRFQEGDDLQAALEAAERELDGFFTFAIGTRDGFAVVRDPVGCKPAVMAETDDWVAMASEFRALAVLPGVEYARVWEPEPGQIYRWSREAVAA
jgi:glutamate synthase domain-containing protein 1